MSFPETGRRRRNSVRAELMGRGPGFGRTCGAGAIVERMTSADPPARAGRDTARRVIPLFRPYRGRVVIVVGLIVLTSTIGIVNPLLIQTVFNKALFVPGGPNLDLLYILVAIMAVVPIVNGAVGILQVYETTKVGQLVMRDLRDRLYSHLETLSLAFFTGTKTGEIQSRLATTRAASSRWSPPPPRPSWPTSSSSSRPSSRCSSSAGSSPSWPSSPCRPSSG